MDLPPKATITTAHNHKRHRRLFFGFQLICDYSVFRFHVTEDDGSDSLLHMRDVALGRALRVVLLREAITRQPTTGLLRPRNMP
jgi:hypothetical protein